MYRVLVTAEIKKGIFKKKKEQIIYDVNHLETEFDAFFYKTSLANAIGRDPVWVNADNSVLLEPIEVIMYDGKVATVKVERE